MTGKRRKFKKDDYARTRGGGSEFFDIHCARCGHQVALYQKDGPGSLLRMYLDRIHEPPDLAELQKYAGKESVPNLSCPHCKALIAVPMMYQPEHRLAFRMVPGSFLKHKSDGTYPSTRTVITP